MEEGITMLEQIRRAFVCKGTDIRTYSPLTLAYIGDAVFDLVIRTVVVQRANRPAEKLHKQTVKYVKAEAQSAMIQQLKEELTEEELAVYKRGRNAKSGSTAKNASVGDYRRATGMEALIGYLYLQDRMERVLELIRAGIEKTGMSI